MMSTYVLQLPTYTNIYPDIDWNLPFGKSPFALKTAGNLCNNSCTELLHDLLRLVYNGPHDSTQARP